MTDERQLWATFGDEPLKITRCSVFLRISPYFKVKTKIFSLDFHGQKMISVTRISSLALMDMRLVGNVAMTSVRFFIIYGVMKMCFKAAMTHEG